MKKLFLLPLLLALVSALLLGACAAPAPTPAPSPTPSPAPSPTPSPAPAPPPTPAPPAAAPAPAPTPEKMGGILKIAFKRPATKFGDPINIKAADVTYAQVALQHLMEPDGKGDYLPILATSWTLSPDDSAYTLKLRQGVKFHDGTDFNAQAVKWNLDRVLSLPVPQLSDVESVDIVDDYTVRLNLSRWSRLILDDLSSANRCFMISPAAFEKNGSKWVETHPVGTGAFMLKEYIPRQIMAFERNPDYWEKGVPYLDGIEILTILDEMTALASLKAGEVHALQVITTDTAQELEPDERFEVLWVEGVHSHLFPKTDDPEGLFYDKRIRMAIEYAIDKEKMASALGGGYVEPVYEVIHSGPGHPTIPNRTYNPEKARELLTEAGYPDGFKTKLIFGQEQERTGVQAIQDYLGKVGIELELEPVARATFAKYRFEGGRGDNMLSEPQGGGFDPLYDTNWYWGTGSGFAVETARPPGFEELLQEALVTKDPDKVNELLIEMETLMYSECVNIPLSTGPWIYAINPAIVKDARIFINGGDRYDYSRAWLTEK